MPCKKPCKHALQEEAAISDILTSQNGPIFEITLNRPQDGNAASDDMAEQLTKLGDLYLPGDLVGLTAR